jgi:hypothetical protein
MMRSTSKDSSLSGAASPATPGLMRSDSYDSQNTTEPRSPITPTSVDSTGRPTSFMSLGGTFKDAMQQHQYEQRLPSFDYSQHTYHMASHSSSYSQAQIYEDDSYPNRGALSPHVTERGQKRYPCRFANEFNCDKTFTTSGHASRHSKIHTAEKAVGCSYEGCLKKFTRSDNMKQHLETHFKDKSRTSTVGRPASRPGPQVLTKPAGIKKPGYASSSRSNSVAELPPIALDPALVQHGAATEFSSPRSPFNNMVPVFQKALETRPLASPRTGLDALAAAAAVDQARNSAY